MIGEYLLPPSNKLPRTYQDLTSIMKYVGMEYQAIDACPNDHILYYNQYEFAIECPICHSSRYRTDQVTKKVSHKVLRYIPIIPRLRDIWYFRPWCILLNIFQGWHLLRWNTLVISLGVISCFSIVIFLSPLIIENKALSYSFFIGDII